MATSDAMSRRPRRFHRAAPCLLLCAASLGLFDVLHRLSFVQGVVWYGTRAAQRQVAQRFSRQRKPTRGEPDAYDKAKVKRLTSRMKKAPSAKELINVLDEAMGGPVFDFIHASAAYTQLVTLKRRKCLEQTDWDSLALLRLHGRVEDMALKYQLNAQASANVLWSLAQLSERFSVPTQLLAALVKSVPTKVKGMKPQELSNCLWASGQLKAVVPEVLQAVPAIVAQIPDKAPDMIPQHLSNCLFAAAQLKDETPKVLEILPAIVGETSLKINGMVPQALSNSVDALVLLRDSVPEVERFLTAGDSMDDILTSAATRVNTLFPKVKGKDLSFAVPVVVWACAKAGVFDSELLDSIARRLGSSSTLSTLSVPAFNLCALSWSYRVLDTDDDFEDFKTQLMSEAQRRGFSEADIQSCQRGRFGWNQAS